MKSNPRKLMYEISLHQIPIPSTICLRDHNLTVFLNRPPDTNFWHWYCHMGKATRLYGMGESLLLALTHICKADPYLDLSVESVR